jgi:hypothetical protein
MANPEIIETTSGVWIGDHFIRGIRKSDVEGPFEKNVCRWCKLPKGKNLHSCDRCHEMFQLLARVHRGEQLPAWLIAIMEETNTLILRREAGWEQFRGLFSHLSPPEKGCTPLEKKDE